MSSWTAVLFRAPVVPLARTGRKTPCTVDLAPGIPPVGKVSEWYGAGGLTIDSKGYVFRSEPHRMEGLDVKGAAWAG